MPTPTPTDQLLTVDDLAALLKTHRKSILHWTSIGWLPPPLRLGPARRWLRWRREVIEAFLRKQEGSDHVTHAS